jgi:hypothetical protein
MASILFAGRGRQFKVHFGIECERKRLYQDQFCLYPVSLLSVIDDSKVHFIVRFDLGNHPTEE